MTVQYRQVTDEFTTVLPQRQDVLVAKLDAGNPDPDGAKDFFIYNSFLYMEPGRPMRECFHGFYNPTSPAYIKMILRTIMGLDESHWSDSKLTPPCC